MASKPDSTSGSSQLKAVVELGAVEAAAQGGQALGIPAPVGRLLAKTALRHKKKVLLAIFLPSLLSLGGLLLFILAVAGVILQGFVITASSMASADVPKTYMAVAQEVGYHDGIPWPLLAAIASETTDFGHSNPYTGKTETSSFPTTTPPIGTVSAATLAVAMTPSTTRGVGPMLLLPSAAAHVQNPQTVRDSMTYLGGQMLKVANHLARQKHKSEQTMYVQPLSKNQSFWGAVVGALPIANSGQCAPPGAVPLVGSATVTPTGGSQKVSTYKPSAFVLSNDIEYVFSCELAAANITLATGPHSTIPRAAADNELVAEALQVSWEYSKDGTTSQNCNPFPIPTGSSVQACVVGTTNEEQQQVRVIEAAAKAVVAQAGKSLSSRTPTEWGVLPGVIVHAPHASVPATTSGNPGTWPSAVPPSQRCQTALFADLAPQSAGNKTGLAEPGPFSPAYPGAPKPKTGKAAYAHVWATSPLGQLRTSPTCTPTTPTGKPGTPVPQSTWNEIVATAASEVYGQLEVVDGSQASVSDLTGLVWYLSSVTKAPAPVLGTTTLVPRLASPVVAPLTTAIPYPAVPSVVGGSGFAAQTVTLAEAYDKATASLVSVSTGGGTIAGIPPGWLQWAQAAGQAECPGYPLMPYLVLAIANHESGFWTPGSTPTNPTDEDKVPVTDGADGVQHAEGPMQFLPPTFAAYAVPVNGAQPNILDPEDALFAAANMLCQDSHGGAAIDAALTVYGFNSTTPYTAGPCAHGIPINLYLSPGWATSCALYYQMQSTAGAGIGTLPAGAVGRFLAAALSQVGHTYVFGAEDSPPSGTFDCSGLVDWAMLQAGGFGLSGLGGPGVHGITTHAEWNLLSAHQVPQSALQPGDLLFYYGLDTTDPGVDHVGIYIGNGLMVDAADPTLGVLIQPYNYPGFYGATLP